MILQPIFSLRTNNFNDPDIIEKITDLWAKALKQLEDHTGSVYGVYHNYDNNYQGDYDLSIAIPTEQPKDHAITLGEQYREFIVTMNQPSSIFEMWQHIWQLEEKGELNRRYDVDYEEYRPDGTVSIFISI